MRPSTTFVSIVTVVVAAGAVTTPASGRPAATGANSSVYTDPAGDPFFGTAPDVTTVVVSNDDSGLITFQITLNNQPTLQSNSSVAVELDADQNPSTGDHGADYRMEASRGSAGPVIFKFCRHAGSGFDCTNQPGSFSGSYPDGSSTLTFRVDRAAIGTPAAFAFHVFTLAPADPLPSLDRAPNSGEWTYQVIAPSAPPRPPPPPPPSPPPSGDTQSPRAKALTSAGFAGTLISLRYQVADNSGRAREQIAVYSGKQRVGQVLSTRLGRRITGRIYTLRWKSLARRLPKMRFCVRAYDPSGNPSTLSCAAIRLS